MTGAAEPTQAKSEITKDFDAIMPKNRVIRLAGEVIDVSVFSTRATLKLIELTSSKESMVKLQSGENIEDLVEIMAVACQRTNNKISKDWLLDNVDMITLVQAVQYVLEPILEKIKDKQFMTGVGVGEEETEKNDL